MTARIAWPGIELRAADLIEGKVRRRVPAGREVRLSAASDVEVPRKLQTVASSRGRATSATHTLSSRMFCEECFRPRTSDLHSGYRRLRRSPSRISTRMRSELWSRSRRGRALMRSPKMGMMHYSAR